MSDGKRKQAKPQQQDLFGAPVPVVPARRPPPALVPSLLSDDGAAPDATPPAVPSAPLLPVALERSSQPLGPTLPVSREATTGVVVSPVGQGNGAPVPAWRAPAEKPSVLSVGELTRQLKSTLETRFAKVIVRGEVTGYRGANPRGHLYFSLKDAEATLDARIWASAAAKLKFKLKDGLSVVAEGSIDLYEPQGRYSLIVSRIEPEGMGALALAFEQLKQRLTDEGLMGPKRVRPPRPIPFLPRRIGVVTSVSGAALKDFLRVLHQRHPRLPVLVCDARVQGEGAVRDVVRALSWLEQTDVDVIVVTRGGGSIEDLWTFNEEAVARAIAACPKPVVSAIGHEIDTTIADLVADYRAPTPSAAAEKLAPVLLDLEAALVGQATRLRRAMSHRVLESRQGLVRLSQRLSDPRRGLSQRRLHLSEQSVTMGNAVTRLLKEKQAVLDRLSERLNKARPQAQLVARRAELEELSKRLVAAATRGLSARRQAFEQGRYRSRMVDAVRRAHAQRRADFHGLVGQLNAMSPLAVLARGYALAFREQDGGLVRAGLDVAPGDSIVVRVGGGGAEGASRAGVGLEQLDEVTARVISVRPGKR